MDARQLSSKVFRFGLFELDLESQQLRKAGVPLRVQPQPFKVLAALMSHPGSIVTREELRRELWGAETFVDFEQGLNYCVRQIRPFWMMTPKALTTLKRFPAAAIASSPRSNIPTFE